MPALGESNALVVRYSGETLVAVIKVVEISGSRDWVPLRSKQGDPQIHGLAAGNFGSFEAAYRLTSNKFVACLDLVEPSYSFVSRGRDIASSGGSDAFTSCVIGAFEGVVDFVHGNIVIVLSTVNSFNHFVY